MSIIQSLRLDNLNEQSIEMIYNDLEIFDKLAQVASVDPDGKEILSLEQAQIGVSALLRTDLQLDFDPYIQLTTTPLNGLNLNLENTSYTMDERANIYYLFFSINHVLPHCNDETLVVAGNYEFDGLGLFWKQESDSFIELSNDGAMIETRYSFQDAFHLLAMFYLSINDYQNYQEAKDNNFLVRGLG